MPETASVVLGASGAGTRLATGNGTVAGSSPCARSSSARPSDPTTTEPIARAPLITRNRRRSQSGIATSVDADPAVAQGILRVVVADVRPAARSTRPRSVRIDAPTASATVTIDSGAKNVPSRSEANRATAPNATKPAAALPKPVRATSPSRPPTVSATIRMTMFRASLSFVPTNDTTKSLAPAGWRSITRLPTATTSDGAPAINPATISATAIATATAVAPATKNGHRRCLEVARVSEDG